MENEKLFNELRAIIADVIEVNEDEIQGDSRFGQDLDVDSVKALEIMVAVERKYKIKIDEARLSKIRNLNDTVALTKEFIEAGSTH